MAIQAIKSTGASKMPRGKKYLADGPAPIKKAGSVSSMKKKTGDSYKAIGRGIPRNIKSAPKMKKMGSK